MSKPALTLVLALLAAGRPALASIQVFHPVADTHVRADHPDANYATDDTLYIDTAPDERRTFMRFALTGITGSITSATLRIFVVDAGNGGAVYTSSDTSWAEDEPTYDDPVPRDGILAGSFPTTWIPPSWIQADVTSAVTGDGPITFVVEPTGSNGTDFESRESSHAPELVVEFEGSTPPVCSIATGESHVQTAEKVSYSATASDPDGGSILFYEWDWSYDGVTFYAESPGQIVEHEFSIPCHTTVAVRATDDEHQTCIDAMSVTVGQPTDASTDALLDTSWDGQPDIPGSLEPLCYILVSHEPAYAGEDVGFQAAAEDPDGGAVVAYEWDLDHDGTSFTPDSTGQTLTYSYSSPGDYTVALRVMDDEGQSATVTTLVPVVEPDSELEGSPDVVEDASSDPAVDPGDDVSYYPPPVDGGCGCTPA